MITLRGLTKRYGDVTAVDDLTVDIAAGRVTGFLGPNGAGKSTTIRLMLGLDRPSAGTALIGGRPYAALPAPLRTVGAVIDAHAAHPGRTGRNHLLAMARTHGMPRQRVDEVLDTVGLTQVARRRIRTYSLGMAQRLAVAGALLGDPEVLLFDEPVNGLDLDGVRWIRTLMRSLAAEGRTVFVSSHLMSEMQLTADHLVVIGRGRLIADAPTADVIAGGSGPAVKVRSPDVAGLERLAAKLRHDAVRVSRTDDEEFVAVGTAPSIVGDLSAEMGLRLHELSLQASSLEDAYLELTNDAGVPVPDGGAATVSVARRPKSRRAR